MDRLIDAAQFENALRVARELAAKAPNDPIASEALARALLCQCNANPSAQLRIETAAAYAKAAKERPTSPGLQSAAGIAAFSAGNIDAAVNFHQKARQLEPGNPQHLYQEAMVWNAASKPESAIFLLKKRSSWNPTLLKLKLDLRKVFINLATSSARWSICNARGHFPPKTPRFDFARLRSYVALANQSTPPRYWLGKFQLAPPIKRPLNYAPNASATLESMRKAPKSGSVWRR